MKQYIGISRDHSGSMRNIGHLAMKDYNDQIASIKENAIRFGIDTIVSTVSCSIVNRATNQTENMFDVQLSSISAVKRMFGYPTDGSCTKLWDSVMMLINQFESVPDTNSPDVGFVLMILTDGDDNRSVNSAKDVAAKIKKLQATDRWTITFRVPKGLKSNMVNQGIPAGNILEVDYSSEQEIEKATVLTRSAIAQTYSNRTKGIVGSSTFYADTSNISPTVVKQELQNVSKRVKILPVTAAFSGYKIQDFVEEKIGGYVLGSAYYELSKREEIQPDKGIVVWNKTNGEYYHGLEARSLLGLPHDRTVKIVPGSMPNLEVFVQSRSVNRKLVAGTKVVVFVR
jgi:hypothetical protein